MKSTDLLLQCGQKILVISHVTMLISLSCSVSTWHMAKQLFSLIIIPQFLSSIFLGEFTLISTIYLPGKEKDDRWREKDSYREKENKRREENV